MPSRKIGSEYDDSDAFYDEWNDARLPQDKFREAIEGIRGRLEVTLGGMDAVRHLVGEIKGLPAWNISCGGVRTAEMFSLRKKHNDVSKEDFEGLIALINPKALCGSQYPHNVEHFAETFHVQDDNFGYLGLVDKSPAEQVKWIACNVLGVDYEPIEW